MIIRSILFSLLSITLLLGTQTASSAERAKVEPSVKKEIKSAISGYNKMLKKSGVKVKFDRAIYNSDKSKIKVVTTWKTKAGEQVENVVLISDEFNEYTGNFAPSKKGKVGYEITARGAKVFKTGKTVKSELTKAVKKYADMFKKAKVGLTYQYSLYNKAKNKIKLVVQWETKAGNDLETIILFGDEFGEFEGNFSASKKKKAQGKKGLPISITI